MDKPAPNMGNSVFDFFLMEKADLNGNIKNSSCLNTSDHSLIYYYIETNMAPICNLHIKNIRGAIFQSLKQL